MNKTVPDDLLVGYIHHALSAQTKATVEAILRESPSARSRLANLRHLDSQIKKGITTAINEQPIPSAMKFSQIAPRLTRRHDRTSHFLSGLTAIAALLVLIAAFIFSLGERPIYSGRSITSTPTITTSITPTPQPTKTTSPLINSHSTIVTRTPDLSPSHQGNGVLSSFPTPEQLWNSIPTRKP